MSELTEDKVRQMIDAAIKAHSETAFHDGDAHGHRRAHGLMIKDARAKQELREAMLTKILTGGAWALAVAVCYAIWAAIKLEVQR